MKIKLLMLVILVLTSGVVVSVPLGKGCIIKYVYLDDVPLEGAWVELHGGVGGLKCYPGQYTGSDGAASFCDLEYGTYYLFVDYDNDGIWDTEDEMVVLDSDNEEVYNYYYSPEGGYGDNNIYCKLSINMKGN